MQRVRYYLRGQDLHIERDKRFIYIAGNQWFTDSSTFIQMKTLKSLTNTKARTIFTLLLSMVNIMTYDITLKYLCNDIFMNYSCMLTKI